jgi:hypothetical protein
MWGQRRHQSAYQEVLDTRAIELAAGVAKVQERHEDECTRRYAVLDNSLIGLHNKLDDSRREREASSRRLYAMMWKTAAATITMLLMIVAYLLTHAAPWQSLVH